jgi:hypothetical protein
MRGSPLNTCRLKSRTVEMAPAGFGLAPSNWIKHVDASQRLQWQESKEGLPSQALEDASSDANSDRVHCSEALILASNS